jgi:hypothetical protein
MGLMGDFLARMKRAHSCKLKWWSSVGVRNQSVVALASLLEDIRPAARLDRRFFSLSAIEMTRVGRTGPCLRWAICWTWQSVIEFMGHCWLGSVSS